MKNNFKKSIRNALAITLCVLTVALTMCSCSSDKKDAETTKAANAVATDNVIIGSGKKLSLNKYINVTYTGVNNKEEDAYSGYSTPRIEVDYLKLVEDIGKKGLKNFYIGVKGADENEAEYFSQNISESTGRTIFNIDLKEDYEYVKNGDEITVVISPVYDTYTVEDAVNVMNISIEKEINITVSGLIETEEIDLMGELEKFIVYKGANGDCEARFDYSKIETPYIVGNVFYINKISNGFEVVYENEQIGTFSYSFKETNENGKTNYFNNSTNLTEGDVLTVTLNAQQLTYNLVKLGYAPKETTREIIVPDRGEYITSKDQLTAAEIEAIKQDIFTKLSEKYTDIEISSAHFATINPGVSCEPEEKTEIHFVYGYNYMLSRLYCCYRVNGISKSKAGELEYEIASSYGYSHSASEIESKLNSNYTYEKLF